MIRSTLRGLWARKRRVVGTATAIVLGVGFLTATLVLGNTFDAGFNKVFRQANAGTDVVVRTAATIGTGDERVRSPLEAQLASTLERVPGVTRVAAEVVGVAQILGTDGSPIGGQGPPTLAGNWLGTDPLNPYRVNSGRGPTRAGEVIIDADSAAKGGLKVGDKATIRTPEPTKVTVVGIAGFGEDENSMGGATYVGFTEAQAVSLLGQTGTTSQFLIRGDGTQSDDQLRDAVSGALPAKAKAEALTGAQLATEQQNDIQGDFLGIVKGFLLAFAGVALVVATFSIANTFTILSAQRSRESALLRAIGGSRRQVLTSAVVEATAIGAIASAVGLVAGLGLARGLRSLLAGFGLDLPGTGLTVEPNALLISFVVGMTATLIAATMPAIRSSRIAPIEALRDAAAESTKVSMIRAALGVVLGVAGAVVMITATSSSSGVLAQAGFGAAVIFVAAVVLGPVIARPTASAVGAPVAATRGLVGQLARRNAMRNPRRTAGSALALVIGAAVVALFATFGASLSHSIDQTVDRSFGGDLVVTQDSFSSTGMSPNLAPAVAKLPQVAQTVALANAIVSIDGSPEFPTVGDPAAMTDLLDMDVQHGSLAGLVPGQVAVSTGFATEHRLVLGDTTTMSFADGERATYEVGAIYGVAELLGDVIMTPQDWTPHAQRPGDVAVLIGLRPDANPVVARQAVEKVAKRFGVTQVEDRQQYIDRVAGQVDQLLTLVYGLLVLAILIALIGLANTLSLSIHERTRELGLLRAIGLTRGRLRSMVRWESMITAVMGTVIGLAMGTFIGWGLVRALSAEEGFISFQVPTVTLFAVLVLSIAAGVAAALRPAQRAAKLDVLAAIAAS